jgi:hypothetical protein
MFWHENGTHVANDLPEGESYCNSISAQIAATDSQSVEVCDVFADTPFVINDLHDFLFPRVDRVPHLCQIAL